MLMNPVLSYRQALAHNRYSQSRGFIPAHLVMRKCGNCTECCTHIGIEETNSPPGVPCRHICSKGCAIYEDRPQACADVKCLWLNGEFSVNDRPDKSKMVVWVTTSKLMTRDGESQPVVYASHRGRPHKKTLRRLIAASYTTPIVVIPGRGNDPKTRTIYWQGMIV